MRNQKHRKKKEFVISARQVGIIFFIAFMLIAKILIRNKVELLGGELRNLRVEKSTKLADRSKKRSKIIKISSDTYIAKQARKYGFTSEQQWENLVIYLGSSPEVTP
ncbi:MAG: hypothetical protein ISS00_00325 [Candidatus Marinimicrobia bacterium]|nr:hypothetical protein [Candidatus Neomarinimicrobiota bacterium]